MPDSTLDIPFLNPVRFYEEGFLPLTGYNNLHFDDDRFMEQIKPWDEPVRYYQKWQTSDIIYLQFRSEFSPINVDLLDCEDNVIDSFLAVEITTAVVGSFHIYQVTIALNSYDPGIYYLKISAGLTTYLVSEPFDLKVKHENTFLINYLHSFNRQDVVFDTGIEFNFRVEGHITGYAPGAEEKGFIDQTYNTRILSSVPYRIFKLIVGGPSGVPDWVPDLINRIQGCNNVEYDGKQYVRAEGAKMERTGQENYPMAAWTIDIREGRNRSSKRMVNGVTVENDMMISYNIQTGEFGDLTGPASTNVIQVIKNQ